MRLKPVTSKGEVFVLPSGDVALLPFEVVPWESNPGGVVIRIGQTTYWFDSDGRYDGPEMKLHGRNEHLEAKLQQLLTQSKENRGKPPATSYFDKEEPGDLQIEHFDDEGIPRKVPASVNSHDMPLEIPEGFEVLDDFSYGFKDPRDLGAFVYNVLNELRVSDVIIAALNREDGAAQGLRLTKGRLSVDDAAFLQILAALHGGVLSYARVDRPPAEVAKCCAEEKHGNWSHPRISPKYTVAEIVCLCGPVRLESHFKVANARETLRGNVVLQPLFSFKQGPPGSLETLREVHRRKIELSDRVHVINVGGIGEGTREEILYAESLGKKVTYEVEA